MGLLRFLLAAAVVMAHATPAPFLKMVGGGVAVSIFFVISGFYMAMILESKYRDQYFLFITNRWFRLAPTYYVVLALALALYGAMAIYTGRPHDRLEYWVLAWNLGHWGAMLVAGVSQLTIIGLDLPALFFYSPETGYSLTGGSADMVAGWRFLFVPQAWSISLEFLFYLIAPFLVRWPTRYLAALALASLALKTGLYHALQGGSYGAWPYEFFPSQLFLFILGILAYRHGRSWVGSWNKPAQIGWGVVFMVLVLFGGLVQGFYWELFLNFAAMLAIPCLFGLTGSNRWDRKLGELSYPIYITHVLISWPLHGLDGKHGESVNGLLLLFLTVLVSAAIYHWFEEPIDRWRQSRLRKSKATGNSEKASALS